MYFVYVLYSLKDNGLYIGQTENLIERYYTHQKGKVRSTRSRRPFVMIYWEACFNREEAVVKEKEWKKTHWRRKLKKMVPDVISDLCPCGFPA